MRWISGAFIDKFSAFLVYSDEKRNADRFKCKVLHILNEPLHLERVVRIAAAKDKPTHLPLADRSAKYIIHFQAVETHDIQLADFFLECQFFRALHVSLLNKVPLYMALF